MSIFMPLTAPCLKFLKMFSQGFHQARFSLVTSLPLHLLVYGTQKSISFNMYIRNLTAPSQELLCSLNLCPTRCSFHKPAEETQSNL